MVYIKYVVKINFIYFFLLFINVAARAFKLTYVADIMSLLESM